MQTNPPILSSVPDKLKSDCINQLDQLLTVVKSSELTAVDLLPKRASAARERRASAARSRAAAVARVKRAAAARQQAAARATARKKYYAQQAAAAARKASIAKAKAAAVVVANRAAAARRQAVAVAAAAATAAANKRRKEQEDANKKLAIQAAIKQAERAEQTRIAQVAAVIKRTAAASRSVIETHITRSEASAGSSFSQPYLRKASYQVASLQPRSAQVTAQEKTKLLATRPQSPTAYAGDGAIDVILYGHDQASLNNASSSYMDRYNECMLPARVTLNRDIVSSVDVTKGKVSVGAGTSISLGIALYDYSASSLNCVRTSAP